MVRYYIIAFFSGSVVLVLETIGARIMAPYLGTAYFVWVNIIGVILGALSLGYWLGGRLADRTEKLLPVIFLAGAASVAMIIPEIRLLPLFGALGIRSGSFVASLLILAPASAVLGMVSPYLIKIAAKDPARVGAASGTLFAYSTLGSIVGTFASGFVLIPHFTMPQILAAMTVLLLLLAIASRPSRAVLPLLLFPIIMVAADSRVAHGEGRIIHEENSQYYNIRVHDAALQDGRTLRTLLLDGSTQSARFVGAPGFPYSYIRLSAQIIEEAKPAPAQVLALGGGGYSIPAHIKTLWPTSRVSVVEIDPNVTRIARDFFLDGADLGIETLNADARVFLNDDDALYDIIYTDAYSGAFAVPWHLTTREAFLHMHDALRDDGLLIVNVASALEGEKAELLQTLVKTMRSVFSVSYVFATVPNEPLEAQNAVVVCAKHPDPERDKALEPFSAFRYDLDESSYANALLLTDAFAPTDRYSEKLLKDVYPSLRQYHY